MSALPAQASGTSSLWQLVLVASLSAVAAVLITWTAIHMSTKHRRPRALVGPLIGTGLTRDVPAGR